MKPTQVTELFANVRKTFVSFFSILMFVALGVGIFQGISWSGPALRDAADAAFAEGALHDFQVQFPYGLTDGDLEKLKALEGVTDVEAGYQSYEEFNLAGEKRTARVQSMNDRIDALQVVEGELPAGQGEIAINGTAASNLGISVGDTITFMKDESSSVIDSGGVSDTSGDAQGADGANANADASSSSASREAPDGNASGSADAAGGDDSAGAGSGGIAHEGGLKYLRTATFKVTALVTSPEYIGVSELTYGNAPTPSGAVHALAWVTFDEFDPAAFRDGYPVVDVRCDGLSEFSTFSAEYNTQSDAIKKRVVDMGDLLAQARYDDLHGKAQAKIDDAQAQLDSAKEQIESGTQQIESGKADLEKLRSEGEAKLTETNDKLKKLQEEYDAGVMAYNEKRQTYEQAMAAIDVLRPQANAFVSEKEQLDAQLANKTITKAQYDQRIESLASRINSTVAPYRELVGFHTQVTSNNLAEGLNTLKPLLDNYMDIPISYEGQTMSLKEAGAKLDEAKQKLDSSYEQLQEGWRQYNDGKAELETKVSEGESKLAEAEQKVEDAKKLVAEKEPKLEEAKEQLANMKDYDWTVLPRSYNPSVAQVEAFIGITSNLSFSMAALFVIVGLLVSYSAVSRIVHEQVMLVGTKKALGLRSREITLSFMLYSTIAVVVGAVIGTAVGVVVVEGIVGSVLSSMFVMGAYPPYFGLPLCIVVVLIETVLVLGATWLACWSILREQAIELLKGEKPPKTRTRFYEKWAVWNRLHLFTQTIVNNCMNDKRRVFSTVVGVAGCTALIVTALTLNNNVLDSFDRHYADVYGFDAIAYVEPDAPEDAIDKMEEKAWEAGGSTAKVHKAEMLLTRPDGDPLSTRAFVAADEQEFSKLYHVNPVSGGTFDLNGEGVWMAQAYQEHFGVKAGDTVEISAGDGVTHRVPVLGFYEYWQTIQEIVMGSEYYESEFGVEYKPNALLVDTGKASASSLEDALRSVDGFDSVSDDKTIRSQLFRQFASVSRAVVFVYLALSILMAVVVLLNLNVMFIEEKKRELIVLMINGFDANHAKRYIFSDSIVLTAIGIILGVMLGCAVGSASVASVEWSTSSFIKGLNWIAIAGGIGGSALLAAIMGAIALRRIPRFDLTDINKT